MVGVHFSVMQTSVLSAEVACWSWSAVRYDVIVSAVNTYTPDVVTAAVKACSVVWVGGWDRVRPGRQRVIVRIATVVCRSSTPPQCLSRKFHMSVDTASRHQS